MNEPKPRRMIRGNIALVVRGGHARIEDAVVISGHRTRAAADGAAYSENRQAGSWLRPLGLSAYVVWADEFVDAGGMYK